MATVRGAWSVLLGYVTGSLEVGKKADIVLYDLETQPFRPLNDPVRQLVFSETGQSVHTVLVNGEVVIENRRLVTIDEADVLREASGIARSLQAEDEKARQCAEALRPYLERMYFRAVRLDVGINRYSRTSDVQ